MSARMQDDGQFLPEMPDFGTPDTTNALQLQLNSAFDAPAGKIEFRNDCHSRSGRRIVHQSTIRTDLRQGSVDVRQPERLITLKSGIRNC